MELNSHLARSDAIVQSQASSIILRIYTVPSLRGASCKLLAGVTGDYPG